jgi:hypothetical protein
LNKVFAMLLAPRTMTMLRRSLGALSLLWLNGAAIAAQHKDPASGCAVIAPRYLANSDYSFQYQGACKAGLAEGKGKAIWTLRASPQNHVVWEGSFSAGVYLPPPQGIVAARAWAGPRGDGDSVLFDLGALPAQNGIPAARLMVLANSDLTNYPDPCKPGTLWAVNAPLAAITGDATAQSLLLVAADKLKTRCGQTLSQPSPGHQPTHLPVRAVATPDLESDPWGNPGPAIVQASVPLAPGAAISGYANSAATRQREQEQQAKDKDERQANAQRLRAFFKTHQAEGWATLNDIAQNPFRYSARVVVTAASVDRVLSPTRATLEARGDGWSYAYAMLDGEGIAQWKSGPRLLAVRVTGRIKDNEDWGGLAQLQLVGSQPCAESRCTDWLRLPAALQDGQVP